MTIEDIETEARRILNDTFEEYRWASSEIESHLQEAIGALNAIRPETRYVNGALVDFVELPQGDDRRESQLAIHPRYREALVYYVVHKCYLDDDTDTANQALAESYLAKFNTKAQL